MRSDKTAPEHGEREPLKMCFVAPENCGADVQMMGVLEAVVQHYTRPIIGLPFAAVSGEAAARAVRWLHAKYGSPPTESGVD